jgi:hypothetical protein
VGQVAQVILECGEPGYDLSPDPERGTAVRDTLPASGRTSRIERRTASRVDRFGSSSIPRYSSTSARAMCQVLNPRQRPSMHVAGHRQRGRRTYRVSALRRLGALDRPWRRYLRGAVPSSLTSSLLRSSSCNSQRGSVRHSAQE